MIRIAILAAVLLGGWLLGSFFPAPAAVKELVRGQAKDLGAQLDAQSIDWQALARTLPAERLAELRAEASRDAAAAGAAILVEKTETVEEAPDFGVEHEEAEVKAPSPQSAAADVGAFEAALTLCPRMRISNAPAPAAYAPIVLVNGVRLAVNPTREACLSSGFGPRNGRPHRGVDYHSEDGGPILAAADGVVLEKKYRDDYGNMLLIDHGQGVYTRYAHLSSFGQGVAVGSKVTAGQEIGLMGNTASYRIPIHLHYELLLGDYANPKASFGLEAKSPFGFPKAS